ncbi:MAG: hypothetical protein VR68_00795 [Peptococcaceae bacterium BRH_c4a]|nr:MAG: hypothetical protein VR68_00795 [Peptococcaceae bacterium BRH_c4a]
MPFKIYTYGDPYRLNQTSFWGEIKNAPHLCVSQVMVNGFRELFEDSFASLLCPIDNALKVLYSNWFSNIERRIGQFIALSQIFSEWKARGRFNQDKLYESLKHNQTSILDALRLFVELGIDVNSLHKAQSNREQKVFIALLQKIQDPSSELFKAFRFDNNFSLNDILQCFQETTKREIEREQGKIDESKPNKIIQNRICHLQGVVEDLGRSRLNRVVIHSIHQFTPLQLRLIMLLDSLGVEVVFLYNYQKDYKEIYSTWDNLYKLFGVAIERDSLLGPYPGVSTSSSRALSEALGQLMEPVTDHLAQDRQRWFNAVQRVQMLEFDNITEYAGFVSRYFDKALKDSPSNPIAAMNEQVYSAGREVHDLLRVYYPEQSGDRHFLCYPIGQFFVGLYRMWSPELGQLKLDWSSLHECLYAGILRVAQVDKLVSILQLMRVYFEDVETFGDFKTRITHYKNQFTEVKNMRNETGVQLRRIAYYHPGIVDHADIQCFEDAVTQLNEIAAHLFVQQEVSGISFVKHFQRLEEFIRKELLVFVEVEEKKLVESLLERFEQVNQNTSLSGTMEDLKNGLYYYLKQKNSERPEWIVRNFTQIEGDILRSRKQHKRSIQEDREEPVYHFACLSDRMMNQTTDDLLPWPLTDYFIRKAYSPVALIFQLYYASIGDYAKFLRYALFYGLYYNECPVRLSYVLHVDDKEEQPYYLLRLLGIKPKRNEEPYRQVSIDVTLPTPSRAGSDPIIADLYEMVDFFLCPYKYFLDYVCSGGIIIDNSFLLKRYYINMLIDASWQFMQRKPITSRTQATVHRKITDVQESLKKYFPFWRDVNDLYDMRSQAENYLHFKVIQGSVFLPYLDSHMKMRLLFCLAFFTIDEKVVHPYPAFEAKVRSRDGKKEYSLHTIRDEEPLRTAIQMYLESDPKRQAIAGDWCNNCAHKNLCLLPYQSELNISE